MKKNRYANSYLFFSYILYLIGMCEHIGVHTVCGVTLAAGRLQRVVLPGLTDAADVRQAADLFQPVRRNAGRERR